MDAKTACDATYWSDNRMHPTYTPSVGLHRPSPSLPPTLEWLFLEQWQASCECPRAYLRFPQTQSDAVRINNWITWLEPSLTNDRSQNHIFHFLGGKFGFIIRPRSPMTIVYVQLMVCTYVLPNRCPMPYLMYYRSKDRNQIQSTSVPDFFFWKGSRHDRSQHSGRSP